MTSLGSRDRKVLPATDPNAMNEDANEFPKPGVAPMDFPPGHDYPEGMKEELMTTNEVGLRAFSHDDLLNAGSGGGHRSNLPWARPPKIPFGLAIR